MSVSPDRQFAPEPVNGPPTPAVFIPPRCPFRFQREAAVVAGSTETPKTDGPHSWIKSCTLRPHSAAKSAS